MADPDYFTLAEFRALPDVSDTTKYPDARVLTVAAYFTSIVENAVGGSFVGRQVVGELHDGGCEAIVLNLPALSVTSVKEGGVTVTGYRLQDGVLHRTAAGATARSWWAYGVGNVEVTYLSGLTATVPGDVKETVMRATRARLLATSSSALTDDRRTSLITEAGTVTFTVAGPDRPTGYPELDAVIAVWADQTSDGGFA